MKTNREIENMTGKNFRTRGTMVIKMFNRICQLVLFKDYFSCS